MARLTYRGKNGKGYVISQGYYNHVSLQIARVAERLTAYEDTGLEPEEVKAKSAWADNVCETLSGMTGNQGIIDLGHLRELVQAEQKRREGCEFCCTVYTKQDWGSGGAHDFRLHDGTLYYCDKQFGWEGMKVKICPMCGRDLKGESHDDN